MRKTLWLSLAMYFLVMAAAIQLVCTIASRCFCFQYFVYLLNNAFETENVVDIHWDFGAEEFALSSSSFLFSLCCAEGLFSIFFI
jgi:hypothetical protein